MTAASEQPIVAPEEVRAELLRVLASPEFAASHQLTSFLQFIVAESLAGREDHLKERTIALGALGRSANFDSRQDCIVRVVAGKLRRALERYYAIQGTCNPLLIEVPKGSYCPVFRHRDMALPIHRTKPVMGASGVGHADSNGGPRPIVAVVSFLSFTHGPEERFLADLLADDVAVRLSRLSWLEVVDLLATRPPDVNSAEPCAIAARLHADFVFAGTVSRLGHRIRLSVRLIDVRSGVLAWVDQFDQEIDEACLEQPDKIADRIACGVGDYLGAPAEAS